MYVIVVWVPGGYGRPYRASKDVFSDKSNKNYYIRKFSSTIIASLQEEKDLFYASTDIPFDDRPNLAASVDDLDLGLMRDHLREIGSDLYGQASQASVLEIAEDMQLVAGPPEDLRPRNVGILMFSEHPERYFRYARIEVVDMPHPNGDGMTEKTFTGPIQRQLRDVLAYIKNYIISQSTTKDPHKAEANVVSNYPYAAIEEILSNAVYHRSYQINEPICVRVTPEAMEITSYPGFDRSIKDEDIAQYKIRSRIYRNRRIGDFLKELHLIEGRNTGFPTAFEALKNNGSELPIFEMDENRGFLSVTIPVQPSFLPTQSKQSKREDEYRGRILEAIKDEPLSLTELASKMGYKGISKKLSSTVDIMLSEGILTRIVDSGNRTKLAKTSAEMKRLQG